MKYIKLLLFLGLVSLLNISCDRDLPYPLEDVKRGVVIDITRAANSDGVLESGNGETNCKVKLLIPKQQGDYSMMDYAQLLCVFTGLDGKVSSKVVVDNIKEFPTEIALDINDIYKKFGLDTRTAGEKVTITANVVLKNGDIIPGWNKYTGYNNKAFLGWQVEDRGYSSSVTYPVVCALNLDDFVGDLTITDNSVFYGGATYNAVGIKISDTELEVQGFFEDANLRIIVDPVSYTVTVPKQVLYPTFGKYTNLYVVGSGSIDACNGLIDFNGTIAVDQGTFGTSQNWKIKN